MPPSRPVRLAGLGIALAGLLTACGGGSTSPTTTLDRDCGAVTDATVTLRLVDPNHVTRDEVRSNVAGAERLAASAANASTPALRAAAHRIAITAEEYAAALRAHQLEHAVSLEALLRQEAGPLARLCGLAPSEVYGAPASH